MDENASKVPADMTIFADDSSVTIDELALSDDSLYEGAELINAQLRLELSPEEALIAGINTAARLVEVRGFANPDAPAWGWILEPVFDLPTGWSTPKSDAEGAALAREQFEKEFGPAVVSIPDAETILAIPVATRGSRDGKQVAGAMIAVPLSGDSTPDHNTLIGATSTAAVVGMQMDNAVRARTAARALQFAQAAARTQRALVEPLDRASALSEAIDALKECDTLVGAKAVELIDDQERLVKEFGDLNASPETTSAITDPSQVEAI
ncbi:MAG: hypothetical protein ACRDKE_09790, partial [Solirubrobacterales bacterium]